MSKTDGYPQSRHRRTTAHERNPIHVKRTKAALRPDPSRVLLRPFTPGDHQRVQRIVTSILSISESDVGPLLDEISSKFSPRHYQIKKLFRGRFEQIGRAHV